MTSLEDKVSSSSDNTKSVETKVTETSKKNVILGSAKKTFLQIYQSWIKKYKYSLFAIVAITTFYIANQQNSFIELSKLIKKKKN